MEPRIFAQYRHRCEVNNHLLDGTPRIHSVTSLVAHVRSPRYILYLVGQYDGAKVRGMNNWSSGCASEAAFFSCPHLGTLSHRSPLIARPVVQWLVDEMVDGSGSDGSDAPPKSKL